MVDPSLAFRPSLNGFQDTARQWPDEVRRRIDAAVARGQRARRRVRTPDDARAYQHRVRTQFWAGAGGLPGDPAALRDATFDAHGELSHLGVRITRLTYESLPNAPVSALLYRPAAGMPDQHNRPRHEERRAAVLFLCGHHREAKHHPEYQRVCLDLALHGLVVLAIDPWGQGERFQYAAAGRDTPDVTDGTFEHAYCGVQGFLTGGAVSRYFAWDAVRALDVLASLPEVDPSRIGVTGNSGGGTQTVLLIMADLRLAAAMPCTYIHGMAPFVRTGLVHDAEQNYVGSLAHGIDHADLLACFAPRPLLVGSVSHDFFPIEAAEQSVAEARRVYAALGAAGSIDQVVDHDRHWYTHTLREHAVRFFTRVLDGEERYVPQDIPTLPEQDLWCSPSGQLYRDRPGLRAIFDLNREYLMSQRRPPPASARNARTRLAAALGAMPPPSRYPIRPSYFPTVDGPRYRAQQVYFFSELEIAVAGTLLRPFAGADQEEQARPPSKESAPQGAPAEDQGRRTWLVLLPDGTGSTPAELQEARRLAEAGNLVFVFDPRGRGAVRSVPTYPPNDYDSWLGQEAWIAYLEMLLGRSSLASRVFDVRRAVRFLMEHEGAPAVYLRGHGVAALWGYLAAALDENVRGVQLTGMLPSWNAIVETRLYDARSITAAVAAPGVLRQLDLPDLQQCFEGRELRIEDPLQIEAPAEALPLRR